MTTESLRLELAGARLGRDMYLAALEVIADLDTTSPMAGSKAVVIAKVALGMLGKGAVLTDLEADHAG